MEGLIYLFIVGSCYLAYWMGVLVFRFVRWLIRPILDEIQHHRIIKEELQKEQQILEEHNRTRAAIDDVVTYYLDQHEQAATKADRQSRRQQSG